MKEKIKNERKNKKLQIGGYYGRYTLSLSTNFVFFKHQSTSFLIH
jgi:hypothetical protein